MYFCTVNVNSSLVICMLSSAHWQLASKLSALEHFELIGKIEINAPVNLIIKKITCLHHFYRSLAVSVPCSVCHSLAVFLQTCQALNRGEKGILDNRVNDT